MELRTDRGFRVSARRIIFAAGYESEDYLEEKVSVLKSTYAVVTQPIPDLSGWPTEYLLWETKRPYVYLRTTDDKRILMGGEDIPFRNPRRRDGKIPQKSRRLLRRLHEMLPQYPIEAEYCWAGTFAETKDSLPYIGRSPEIPNACFALGFGGNGITFGVLAADILCDLHCGRANPNAHLFRFGR
jgi:glycine/D-amino acid oxidase-like deaminating enzyme